MHAPRVVTAVQFETPGSPRFPAWNGCTQDRKKSAKAARVKRYCSATRRSKKCAYITLQITKPPILSG